MSKIIGIDLGTSNSAAAFLEGGKPTIIPAAEGVTAGGKAFPSYVAFTKDGQLLVGEPARRQAVSNPEGTISAFKRKMGQDFKYTVQGKDYSPQQLSAFILQKIKRDAESFLGDTVDRAVITVPAYFNDNQRQATKDAGTIAGLDVVRIINEPTAACLAYGLDKAAHEEKIMVFDLGGGTLDVTIMRFWEVGGAKSFDVISTAGDTQLGGTDMDNALVDYIAGQFKREHGIDLRNDKMAAQRIREAAEKAKIELSNVMETDINLPFITADASGPKHLTMKITRATLEQLVRPIVERCAQSIEQAINDAKNKSNSGISSIRDITRIIPVGGPTRMPIVLKFLEEHVGRKVERGVDPMECVALGAAIEGGIIGGEVKDIVHLDVTPLSLGLETLGGVFTRLIERNTTIPTRKSEVFTTAADNQPMVEVHVLQGERPLAKDNTSLGRFTLDGIPPAPRGVPQIEVSFDIDENGIIHVSAKDRGTGKEQSIRISAPQKLSKEEIDRAIKEAERFAEQDKKTREIIEERNSLDQMIYGTEKSLHEHGDKLSQDERLEVERAVSEAKEKLKLEDPAALRQAKDALIKASYKLGEAVYKETKGSAGGGARQAGTSGVGGATQEQEPPTGGAKGKGDVIDADFKENR
jgi:molecular chaperone DnaK